MTFVNLLGFAPELSLPKIDLEGPCLITREEIPRLKERADKSARVMVAKDWTNGTFERTFKDSDPPDKLILTAPGDIRIISTVFVTNPQGGFDGGVLIEQDIFNADLLKGKSPKDQENSGWFLTQASAAKYVSQKAPSTLPIEEFPDTKTLGFGLPKDCPDIKGKLVIYQSKHGTLDLWVACVGKDDAALRDDTYDLIGEMPFDDIGEYRENWHIIQLFRVRILVDDASAIFFAKSIKDPKAFYLNR